MHQSAEPCSFACKASEPARLLRHCEAFQPPGLRRQRGRRAHARLWGECRLRCLALRALAPPRLRRATMRAARSRCPTARSTRSSSARVRPGQRGLALRPLASRALAPRPSPLPALAPGPSRMPGAPHCVASHLAQASHSATPALRCPPNPLPRTAGWRTPARLHSCRSPLRTLAPRCGTLHRARGDASLRTPLPPQSTPPSLRPRCAPGAPHCAGPHSASSWCTPLHACDPPDCGPPVCSSSQCACSHSPRLPCEECDCGHSQCTRAGCADDTL